MEGVKRWEGVCEGVGRRMVRPCAREGSEEGRCCALGSGQKNEEAVR